MWDWAHFREPNTPREDVETRFTLHPDYTIECAQVGCTAEDLKPFSDANKHNRVYIWQMLDNKGVKFFLKKTKFRGCVEIPKGKLTTQDTDEPGFSFFLSPFSPYSSLPFFLTQILHQGATIC